MPSETDRAQGQRRGGRQPAASRARAGSRRESDGRASGKSGRSKIAQRQQREERKQRPQRARAPRAGKGDGARPLSRPQTKERLDLASGLSVDGRTLQFSNLTKVLYPEAGFTKGDVISYLVSIAPVLLPHISDRPLTLKRYPNGVDGMFFYEKRCPMHRPPWVPTAKIWSDTNEDNIDYCLCNDRA